MPRYTKFSQKRYGEKRDAASRALARSKRAAALTRERKMSVAVVKSIARGVVSRSKETKELAASSAIGQVNSSSEWLIRLSNIGQGDTDADRDGDKVVLKHLTFNVVGESSGDDSAATATNPVRIMIVKAKRRAVPTALTTADFPDYWTRITEQQREKYTVVKDLKFMARSSISHVFDGTSGSNRKADEERFQRHFSIPLNHTIRWAEGDTASTNHALMGDVYAFMTCRNAGAAGGLQNVTYEKDLTFKEF